LRRVNTSVEHTHRLTALGGSQHMEKVNKAIVKVNCLSVLCVSFLEHWKNSPCKS